MRRIIRSGGQGKLGCIVWVAVLLLFLFIAYKTLPVKLHATQLYDYMDEQARFGGRASTGTLKNRILRRAKQLELPVESKHVKVEKIGGRIRMRATFTVPVVFPGYTYNWKFDLTVDRPVFIV